MILRGSGLFIKRVPTTQIYLASVVSKQSIETLMHFLSILEQGHDLDPVHLVSGAGVIDGMYLLEDGRKRYCAALMGAQAHVLALVEHRQA
jgi:hypothetical protein